MRLDVVPEGTTLEPIYVKLQTVTGQMAILMEGTFVFAIGNIFVTFQAWVAEVKDSCVLGLDFLRRKGFELDLRLGNLILPGKGGSSYSPNSTILLGFRSCTRLLHICTLGNGESSAESNPAHAHDPNQPQCPCITHHHPNDR